MPGHGTGGFLRGACGPVGAPRRHDRAGRPHESHAPSNGVYRLGGQDGPIDGTAEEIDAVDTPDDEGRGIPETSALAATDAIDATGPETEIPVPSRTGPSSRKETVSPSVLARPKNLKELE